MSNQRKVRVRFAPSPTGGLHLGGVRTALFNYLFARQHKGDFIVRIEDTDQTRFVEGAESYIYECLNWCGIQVDESPIEGGSYGPYRQSERKPMYRTFAEQLVEQGNAYYAFDTPEDLDHARKSRPNFRYDHLTRTEMRNSLQMNDAEVQELLQAGTPHVIRLKVNPGETIAFMDMIRGQVSFESDLLDDKVLLKADGMPTYHLAVVVDDYKMEISHVFRGEEWLPSAPIHILLWEYLGWSEHMPQWAHLPLILKPDGHGKLSKRDGERLGFPVFAMDWYDKSQNHVTKGYRELGFLPEAFVNMLAMLGWNDGTEKEVFSMSELIQAFSVSRINSAGAKFSYDKAKWYNHTWIQNSTPEVLMPLLLDLLESHQVQSNSSEYLKQVFLLTRERLTLLSDFWDQAGFFFQAPQSYDLGAIKKWDNTTEMFFKHTLDRWASLELDSWNADYLEQDFKQAMENSGLKPGAVMLPLRIFLVGGKFGPHVFTIAETLGPHETCTRIERGLLAI